MYLGLPRTIQDYLYPNEIIIVSFNLKRALFEQETLWSLFLSNIRPRFESDTPLH